MDQKHLEQNKEQSKTYQRGKTTAAADVIQHHHCKNCGAHIDANAMFCEECGAPQRGNTCVSCGAQIKAGMVICPVCGRPSSTECTFCGAQISLGDPFCPECGNPRGGLICPRCQTVNYRSFCRKCNYPLNPMALHAVEEAKRDPRYIRAQSIAQEIGALEDEIEQLESMIASGNFVSEQVTDATEKVLEIDDSISDETMKLMEEFNSLSGSSWEKPANPVPVDPKPKAAPSLSAKSKSDEAVSSTPESNSIAAQMAAASQRLADLKKMHAAKVEELQQELDAMVPPASAPPEVKRNFACAHKITISTVKKVREPIAWVCNECHIWHNNPSECGVREYGGKWVYQDKYVGDITTTSINV